MEQPIARVEVQGQPVFVEVEPGGGARCLSAAPWRGGERTGECLDAEALEAARWCCPVEPSKILCVGRNYRAHAEAMGHEVPDAPLLFFKPPSSLLEPGGSIVLPASSERVEHEVELAVVVGRTLKDAGEAEAAAAIWGLTIALDVTARDLQRSDRLWTRAKGFDTFCPVGPVVVGGLEVGDRAVRCRVGGELRQDGRTSQMVFSPAHVLAYISRVMRLERGDLLLTGSPAGNGPLAPGDRVVASIEGIGALEVGVS